MASVAEATAPTDARARRRDQAWTATGVVRVVTADGRVVCDRCVVADRFRTRTKGLLGRRELAPGEALMLRPAPSIHTFFMRFAIDAVFVGRDGRVLKVKSDVRPWRIRSCRRAAAVIELAAGEARRREIDVGDALEAVTDEP